MGNTQVGGAHHRKLEILQRVHDFPVTLRETTHRLREEDAELFLKTLEESLIELLYGIKGNGLDCERDTHDQVETAIRFFPQVLCERYWGLHPPIYAQLAYFKSVPFIPLLAKLGIEFHQFQNDERGGLIYRDWNVLRSLANNDCNEWYDEDDEYQQCLVDEKYAAVMKSLEEMGIFRKEDVSKEDLMWELSHNNYFPERRFRYLVNFDPTCYCNRQPSIYRIWLQQNDIDVFQIVFELGALHFPTEMGFLFHLDKNDGYNPFDRACYEFGTEKVTKIIEDVLVTGNHYDDEVESDGDCDNIILKALIYAATNSTVHLDGVYLLLRRDPGPLLPRDFQEIPAQTRNAKNGER
jgi:hypothetical protein